VNLEGCSVRDTKNKSACHLYRYISPRVLPFTPCVSPPHTRLPTTYIRTYACTTTWPHACTNSPMRALTCTPVREHTYTHAHNYIHTHIDPTIYVGPTCIRRHVYSSIYIHTRVRTRARTPTHVTPHLGVV